MVRVLNIRLTRVTTIFKWATIFWSFACQARTIRPYPIWCLVWSSAAAAVATGLIAYGMGHVSWAAAQLQGAQLNVLMMATGQWPTAAPTLFVFLNLMLACVAAAAVVLLAPDAAGSGVPELMAYFNNADIPRRFLSLDTFAVKVVGSVMATTSRLVVGKEGALLHVGACVAHIFAVSANHVSAAFRRSTGGTTTVIGGLTENDVRDLVAVGAAAGVAAAFRAPIGGMLYVMELSTRWRPELTWRTFFACAVTSFTMAMCVRRCTRHDAERCAFFTSGGLLNVEHLTFSSNLGDVVPVAALGVIGGLGGAAFNKLNVQVSKWRRDHWGSCIGGVLEVAGLSLVTSAAQLGLPFVAGVCQPCVSLQRPTENSDLTPECAPHLRRPSAISGFGCPADHYNDLAVLILNSPSEVVAALVEARPTGVFSLSALAAASAFLFAFASVTYGAKVPSGLFTPNLVIGGAIGRLYASALAALWSSQADIDAGMYAVLGAAAVFGGTMRCTVSICVILLETTATGEQLPFLMLVLVIAKGVADRFNDSIFVKLASSVKRLAYIAHMPHLAIRRLRLKAGAVATAPLAPLPALVQPATLEWLLRAGGDWEVWPVSGVGTPSDVIPPDTPRTPVPFSSIIGFVERSQLVRLLVLYQSKLRTSEGVWGNCEAGDESGLQRPSAGVFTLRPHTAAHGTPSQSKGTVTVPSTRRLARLGTMQAEGALWKGDALGLGLSGELSFQAAPSMALLQRPNATVYEEGSEGSTMDGSSPPAAEPRQASWFRWPRAWHARQRTPSSQELLSSPRQAMERATGSNECVIKHARPARSFLSRIFLSSPPRSPTKWELHGGAGVESHMLPRADGVEGSLAELDIAPLNVHASMSRLGLGDPFASAGLLPEAPRSVGLVAATDDGLHAEEPPLAEGHETASSGGTHATRRHSWLRLRFQRAARHALKRSSIATDLNVLDTMAPEVAEAPLMSECAPPCSGLASGSAAMLNLEALVRRPGLTIEPGLSIERVFQLFNGMACRFLPVVDSEGHLQGVITRARMVRCQWRLEQEHAAAALPAVHSENELL